MMKPSETASAVNPAMQSGRIKETPTGRTKVKICGITSREEAGFLNEFKADYAGFVFYEKSRRFVSFQKAKSIADTLAEEILKVAVTVSPTLEFVRELERLGFDLLQVHGELAQEVREKTTLPVWRAVNITNEQELEHFFEEEKAAGMEYIQGYVADGAGYGGGTPFDWEELSKSVRRFTEGKELILAGGLTEENVTQGICCFKPDVADVSSSVEENGKKSRIKIEKFIRKVREHG